MKKPKACFMPGEAVRSNNNTIMCFRTQNFNVSQLGAQPNVYAACQHKASVRFGALGV